MTECARGWTQSDCALRRWVFGLRWRGWGCRTGVHSFPRGF